MAFNVDFMETVDFGFLDEIFVLIFLLQCPFPPSLNANDRVGLEVKLFRHLDLSHDVAQKFNAAFFLRYFNQGKPDPVILSAGLEVEDSLVLFLFFNGFVIHEFERGNDVKAKVPDPGFFEGIAEKGQVKQLPALEYHKKILRQGVRGF